MLSGVLAFGAIVYGGVRYAFAAGNPSAQSEGKEWIKGALIGLFLLVSTYVILNVINPNIVKCTLPELVGVTIEAPSPTSPWGDNASLATCQAPPRGGCSTQSLMSVGGACFGDNISVAGGVCGVETANGALLKSTTDVTEGTTANPKGESVSFGLFQINISANKVFDLKTATLIDCPKAFDRPFTSCSYTGTCPKPKIVDRNLYNKCRDAALDANNNIARACSLSNGGTDWSPWGRRTRDLCGV